MTTTSRPAHYRIFLLTVWHEDANDATDPESWRFRLEDPTRDRQQGCVGVSTLVATLIHEIKDLSQGE